MKVKIIRSLVFCVVTLLLAAPILSAEDLSKYRSFALGTGIATVLKSTDQTVSDLKTVHDGPTLFQELTWWPAIVPGGSHPTDNVEQILFSFYKGELYKMSVTYDRKSTEGLTPDDMVNSISAKYGPATSVALAIDSTRNDPYEAGRKPIASWEDSQYSFNLLRSSFSGDFELVIYSKPANAKAEAALAEAVELDKKQGPQREAARQKKETDDLEVARQKNRKTFRP
jgi:hypothetical protein